MSRNSRRKREDYEQMDNAELHSRQATLRQFREKARSQFETCEARYSEREGWIRDILAQRQEAVYRAELATRIREKAEERSIDPGINLAASRAVDLHNAKAEITRLKNELSVATERNRLNAASAARYVEERDSARADQDRLRDRVRELEREKQAAENRAGMYKASAEGRLGRIRDLSAQRDEYGRQLSNWRDLATKRGRELDELRRKTYAGIGSAALLRVDELENRQDQFRKKFPGLYAEVERLMGWDK